MKAYLLYKRVVLTYSRSTRSSSALWCRRHGQWQWHQIQVRVRVVMMAVMVREDSVPIYQRYMTVLWVFGADNKMMMVTYPLL